MAAEMLKIQARDELVRITQDELTTKFEKLSARQQSIAATKFYVREIHSPVRSFIADDEMDAAIVDGKDDLGCDLIHRDNGHVTMTAVPALMSPKN